MTKAEFDKWIHEIQYIVFDCHISFRNLQKILARPAIHPDWRDIAGFLDHLRTQYYFTLITQLAKLFCEGSQHLRFQLLIGRLGASSTSRFVRECLSVNSLDDRKSVMPYCWNDELAMKAGLDQLEGALEANKEGLRLLKRCRDNNIAHTSSTSSTNDPAPTVDQLGQLVALANKIFTDLRAGLGMPHVSFDTDHAWSIDPVFTGWMRLVDMHYLKRDLFRIHRMGSGPVLMECNHDTGSIGIRAIEHNERLGGDTQ